MEFWQEASDMKLKNTYELSTVIYVKFYESGCWDAYLQSEWMRTRDIRVYIPNTSFDGYVVGSMNISCEYAQAHRKGFQKIIYEKIDPFDDRWQIPIIYDWSGIKIRRSI